MKKILIVDDEPAVLTFVTQVAESLQYEVLTAKDGLDALLNHGEDISIDALITDVKMPGVDGFQLAQAMRAKRPDLPILFISGFFEETEAPSEIMGTPGTFFLSKPFSPQKLGSGLLLLFTQNATS